ncbi:MULTISPECIES: hypothetical protein [unclassified Rhizobium]|uniref:hypothetical protein n=1 Tax=unclassified Rhizobium TaxID=2613769 RepID=UPI0006477CBF|nr:MULTISPECIES: hypothetical protein [unclassified Rhizobium]MBN8954127.1 hypothetical protein [Rhizobium tropici]OJY75871.1 MAG: hypothetical protein BGP09_19315 [Rhizobium sp. 60-20]RKD52341.1 hypothetical protein BJ928_11564 [Rhizobium sp. WW_1]
MRLMRPAIIAFSLAVLASCSSQEEGFEKIIPILKESPSARAQVIDKCMSQHMSPEMLDEVAFYVRSQRSEAKRLFCQRMTTGLASGRISYADFKALFQQKKVTPALVSALKGR